MNFKQSLLICLLIFSGTLQLNAQSGLTTNYEKEGYSIGIFIGPQVCVGASTPDSLSGEALIGRYVGGYFRFNIPKVHAFVRAEMSSNSFALRMKNTNEQKVEFDGSMFEFAATGGFYFGKKKFNLALFGGPAFSITSYKFKPSNQTFSITSENETPLITQWKAGLCFERAPMTFTLAFKQDITQRVAKSLVEAYPLPDNERQPYRLSFIELGIGMYL